MVAQRGKVYRLYMTPTGEEHVLLRVCDCKHQRGPAGGVCRCGGAILYDGERLITDDMPQVSLREVWEL